MAFHFLGQQRESLGRVWCQCCMDFLLANAWGIGCPKLDFISDQSAGFFGVWLSWCGYEGGERSWWSVSIHLLMPKERCAAAPLHILGWLVASASWTLPDECQWCFTSYWLEECRWAFDIGSCCFGLWPHIHLPASQATPWSSWTGHGLLAMHQKKQWCRHWLSMQYLSIYRQWL